jgi:hypothetical protein
VVAVTGRGGVCAWGNNTHGLPGVEPRGGQTGRPVTLEGLTDPVGFEINPVRAGRADQPVGRLVQLDLPGHRPARAHDCLRHRRGGDRRQRGGDARVSS